MASLTAILVIATLTAQTICAPQIKKETSSATTIRSAANFSKAELQYILNVRSGVNATPIVLTPCARAILSCCNGLIMNESCSEDLKCGAYFFDANPCDRKFVIDALNAARDFYEQFNRVL